MRENVKTIKTLQGGASLRVAIFPCFCAEKEICSLWGTSKDGYGAVLCDLHLVSGLYRFKKLSA